MLRVHRNSIRILLPLFIGSLFLSAFFYKLSLCEAEWFEYFSNVFLGIMGSSLLSLILAIVGYLRERTILFQDFYNKICDILSSLSKYKECAPDNYVQAKLNGEILRSALGVQIRELGDLYAEMAFIFDKHDPNNRKNYLFSTYQYFYDMKTLTRHDWSHLENESCPQFIRSHTDDVILNIQNYEYGYSVYNRAVRDFESEHDTFIKLINGQLSFKEKLSFKKTPVTDKVFALLTEDDEKVISYLNKLVEDFKSRKICISSMSNEKADDLFKKGLISGITTDCETGRVVGVEVSDKAYYYFGYKKRYQLFLNTITLSKGEHKKGEVKD